MSGLAASLHATGTDPFDGLDIETFGGNDSVDSAQLAPGLLTFSVNDVVRP